MAVLFVDSGDGLYTCVGLHITSSLHNDNNDIFIGVCVTRVTVNIRCFICCSLVKNEGVQSSEGGKLSPTLQNFKDCCRFDITFQIASEMLKDLKCLSMHTPLL